MAKYEPTWKPILGTIARTWKWFVSDRRIMYSSRGLGRGHAVIDIEIARALTRLRSDLEVTFVSHGTGADTFRRRGHAVVDLGLPDHPDVLETLVRVTRLIARLKPTLVIAHETFMALPAAKAFDIRSILITHWFVDPNQLWMQCLRYADRVVFVEEPGIFLEPPWVRGKVDYVGPAVRPFSWSKSDRARARRELSIPDNCLVLLVLPGSLPEAAAPICDTVTHAFDSLEVPAKRMVWLSGSDYVEISRRLKDHPNVTVLESDPQIDRLMAAGDLAVTKGTYNTTRELTALGVPSIAITWDNFVDDVFAIRNPAVTVLAGKELDRRSFANCLRDTVASLPSRRFASPASGCEGIVGAAEAINRVLVGGDSKDGEPVTPRPNVGVT
jgi:UDP-N-acetylglucosamine:LPS N-acetylglucosamine transferase